MNCANPKCAKPLHYLREGRIFVFDAVRGVSEGDSRKAHRMEHYWLCGSCSKKMMLEQTMSGVRVVEKVGVFARESKLREIGNRALAS